MKAFLLLPLSRVVAALTGLLLAGSLGAAAFPDGTGKLEVTVGGTTMEVFTHKPADYKAGPLIVVFHGMLRNGEQYRDNAIALGNRFGALIAAPQFDSKRFPSEAYQRGGVTKAGKVQPVENWTYHLVPKIVDEVRRAAGRADMPYYFIGHSAGGQFLVRLTAMLPAGAVRVVAANPGAHIFPTREVPFAYGFGQLPESISDDTAIKRFLAQPLTIFLGTADTGEKDLDMTAPAMKQGDSRIERGRNCFATAQQLAQEKGWPFHWSIVEVPGVGHDSRAMFNHANAEAALFSARCLIDPASRKSPQFQSTPAPGTKPVQP